MEARWKRALRVSADRRRLAIRRHHRVRRLANALRQARAGVPSWPWGAVSGCESGGRWDYNGPSGFDGGIQFHPSTWTANRLPGYPAFAYLASPFQQVVVGEIVLAASGWGQWPACSRKLGLR